MLYIDDLKFTGRSEEKLWNKIKVVKTISSYIKTVFGLEKCDKISLKSGKVHSKQHIQNTMENENNKSDSTKKHVLGCITEP